jgi:hypothetical protein
MMEWDGTVQQDGFCVPSVNGQYCLYKNYKAASGQGSATILWDHVQVFCDGNGNPSFEDDVSHVVSCP